MDTVQARVTPQESMSAAQSSDVFPVLQQRKQRPLGHGVEIARRELWRAFQRGALSEDELASTLDRLEFERT
jgi:hypothetical protein